jgi:flagellum-specific peptidoglycan hydrolase FlgJ
MTISLLDVVKHYKGLDHQKKAIQALESALEPALLSDDAEWIQLWRSTASESVSSPDVIENTWDGIKAAATAAGAKFPECVAAQWALESAWGSALSGKNNYFGIKGPGTKKTTWEDYGNGPVTIVDEFQDFATPYDCVNHLVTQWYKDYRGYQGVNRASTREECALLLKSEGYATDPVYAQKLINLMNSND